MAAARGPRARPGLVFLSEAFTRPKLMRALAKLGFSQSYTYFTWRNHKRELTEYFQELRRPEWADAMRPNLWPNTPDILPEFLQRGGPPAFRIRVALAATLGASYGIYSGYEFCDAAVLHGEEYRDSEKYQLVDWRARRSGDIREWIGRLNEIRHAEPALQSDEGLEFFECDDPQVIFYGKRTDDGTSQVLVAVSLDPYRTHTASCSCRSSATAWPGARWWRWRSGSAASGSSGGGDGDGDLHPRDAGRGVDRPGAGAHRADLRLLLLRGSRMTSDDPLWFKSAIIYELHVRAFFDSNGDGKGDIQGLITKLPYLQDLGVNCLWLLPMYPSPLRDDGYDIADFYAIHPDYGTLEDFQRLVDAAHARGHPRPHRAGGEPHQRPAPLVPGGAQQPRQPQAQLVRVERHRPAVPGRAHHLHRHRALQLDLGPGGQAVLLAPLLQPPARPQLRQPRGPGGDAERHALLAAHGRGRLPLRRRALPLRARGHQLREPARDPRVPEAARGPPSTASSSGRVLLAEANQWPSDVRVYFGDGDEFHMGFHFPVMPRIFMSVRREERTPIVEIMQQTPDIPENCQWAIFLRNHDELTLEMVTDEDRDYMYQRVRQGPADEAEPRHPAAAGAR